MRCLRTSGSLRVSCRCSSIGYASKHQRAALHNAYRWPVHRQEYRHPAGAVPNRLDEPEVQRFRIFTGDTCESVLSAMCAPTNPNFRMQNCISWNYVGNSRQGDRNDNRVLVDRTHSVADREFDQRNQVFELQLLHQSGAVRLDRPWREMQPVRDLRVGLPFGDQLYN